MTKTTKTITVDVEVWEQAAQTQDNLSGTINNFLKDLIDYKKKDITSIDITLTKIKLDQLIKEITKKSGEKKECEDIIKKWEEIQNQEKIRKLEEQKEAIAKESCCANCGKNLTPEIKKIRFAIGLICNSCFQTADKNQVQKWSSKLV